MKYKHKERTNTQTNKPTKGFQFESKKETQIKKRIESKFIEKNGYGSPLLMGLCFSNLKCSGPDYDRPERKNLTI